MKYDTRPTQIIFIIFGALSISFGAGIALFDFMFDPVWSALLGVIYIGLGSFFVMLATALFLERREKLRG